MGHLQFSPLLLSDQWGCVFAGGQEGSLEDQWEHMGMAADVLATAPDDEVLAEILALQSELTQQVCD